MAIVFISPRERQKVFILAIIGFFVIFLIIISFSVFLAKPKKPATLPTFIAPEIRINFDVLRSPQLIALKLLPDMEIQFSYTAKFKGKAQIGKILASSKEKAQEILIGFGYTDIIVEDIEIGRENPFSPYYEIKPLPTKKTKK